jgi:3',5'-cyclic-nucleotide phosphodiesterase
MSELRQLAAIVNPLDLQKSLRGLPVIVTHVKPRLVDLSNSKDDTRAQIINELSRENDIGVELIKPEQGIILSL